ncbi:MAG TPA: RecQ family ATP-dependent DNA helicase [Ilumatobacteraceae bacterium]|nr:RecQ family ATP-dependent DNA helicase [Ilumatobacteraceae bacterium]
MSEPDALLDALRRLTGRPDAEFRDGQREAIQALVDDRARVLVVQRTGWGKSAVYFLTTHLLRQQGLGPTLLISPLLALMRNQIEAARRLGLRCETINSASNTTIRELEEALRRDEIDLLLISPERLANPEFGTKIMPLVGARPGLIVIDEVHCISDWGHDFRPDYRRIGRIVDRLAGTSVPILGCTATANDRVVSDVADQLGAALTTFRGPLHREGLALSTLRLDRQAERLAWLVETLPTLEGSGIVYCLTVRDVENVADWLTSQGLVVEAYYGSLDNESRVEAERKLQTNEIKALVATTALGMGYDKPDLGFVVHFQSPGSPVAYYQQVGRAGRALETSQGILLRGLEDEQIQDWFIEQAFAEEHLVNDIVHAFDGFDGPVPLMRIQVMLNVRIGTLELVVKQLDVDGVLERVTGTSYQRTLQTWTYPASRIEAVTAARRHEQASMVDYFHTTDCRMRFIANLLDDPMTNECGICDNCTGDTTVHHPAVELVAAAERFLQNRPIEFTPRKMYLDADTGARKKIPVDQQIADGRVLAAWGDAGWGQLVRTGKLDVGRFDDRLVDALVELMGEWSPAPAPEWVTCVPSTRHPELVVDLAQRVAAALGLPFEPVLSRVDERPPQREQRNSAHQQFNVEGAFAVSGSLLDGPVLLVDDLVDSGWTLTETGRLLRRAGADLVYPMALASSAGRS